MGLGTQNPQQHTVDRILAFTLRIDPDLAPCPLLEPLCHLLEANPELALAPRTPSEWAELFRELIPNGTEKPKQLGYGAVARCFWFHRSQLEKRLIIIKSPNPGNIGHLYQISLRPEVAQVEEKLEVVA